MSWMQIAFWVVLVLLLLGLVIWSILLARFARANERDFRERINALLDILCSLEEGKAPARDRLHRAASNPRFRHELYTMLLYHRRLELFPKEFFTWESFALGEMVEWLCHPNELGCPPDAIELMAKVPVGETCVRHYFVFRFRASGLQGFADGNWLAGATGPYHLDAQPKPGRTNTFSRFDPYGLFTPEQHVRRICEATKAGLVA